MSASQPPSETQLDLRAPAPRPLAGSGWRAPLHLMSALGRAALDVIYPPHCLACMASTQASDGVCGSCWQRVRFIARPFCERLGTPFHQDLGAGLVSPEAIAHPPAFGRARAAVLFDDGPARRLVHRLKYGDRLEVARLLGRWMARAAAELAEGAPVLVPMPLHRGRLARRQFNQAALLADVMAEAMALTCDVDLLHRVKATAPQVGMTRSQRAANVQGAFRVPAHASVAGRRVLLVDDVLTTGATANAAARALLRGGAASVDLVVFARVAAAPGIAI